MSTNLSGLFTCRDVAEDRHKHRSEQIIIVVAEGAIVAKR